MPKEPRPKSPLQGVGVSIRRHREDRGLTQEELAERCGLHSNYIGLVERGERNVPILTLMVIAEGLRVRPSDLLIDVAGIGRGSAEHELRRLRRYR